MNVMNFNLHARSFAFGLISTFKRYFEGPPYDILFACMYGNVVYMFVIMSVHSSLISSDIHSVNRSRSAQPTQKLRFN